jgi:PAS domain S-box-containing protein
VTHGPVVDAQHRAIDEVVLSLAQRENLLAPDAWDEIVATMRRHVAFARAGVTLRDGPEHYRLYALSTGPGYDFAPFQQRLPVLAHTDEVVYRRREPYFCDDTSAGSVVEQMLAHAGYFSYVLVPLGEHRPLPGESQEAGTESEGPDPVGDVLFVFEQRGAARAAPIDLLLGFAGALAEAMPRAVAAMRVHRLSRILETSQSALLAWDAVGCITDTNEAAERLLARPRHELLGRPAEEILGDGGLEPTPPAGSRRTLERSDGSRVVVNASVARSAGDPLVAGYALLRDLTEVVHAEQRLVQSDRLATLGMLAAGVAHEINNPAAFLLLGIELVGRRARAAQASGDVAALAGVDDLLRDLRESTERIVSITRDLRLFATPGGGVPVLVDVGRAIDGALTLVRAQVLERADLEVHVDASLPPVRVEEGRLSQVVVNLVINAVQAIPKGTGREVVRVEARTEGTAVRLDVADTGEGIAPEVLERVWTPFFTTKEGQGTGLGLSISRGIVERAGGSIRVESPSGLREGARGARFVVTLPAAGAPEESAVASTGRPPSGERARRTVLVVEDEQALARALVEQLGAVHDVTLVSRGDDAVRILATRRFDVVLCDLRMPGLSGEAVYQRVAARDPDQAARFVFMTGVGFGEETKRFLDAVGVAVLEKPFALEDALKAIGRAGRKLEGRPAG